MLMHNLLLNFHLFSTMIHFGYPGFAGREKSEERRNGDVCNSTCYNVLHNADPLDPQGVAVVIKLCCHLTP